MPFRVNLPGGSLLGFETAQEAHDFGAAFLKEHRPGELIAPDVEEYNEDES